MTVMHDFSNIDLERRSAVYGDLKSLSFGSFCMNFTNQNLIVCFAEQLCQVDIDFIYFCILTVFDADFVDQH